MKKRAHAKVNLGLKIISKRIDGYHDLESIMMRVGLYDELEFLKSDKLEIVCDNIEMENNLVYKIAFYLKTKYKIEEGIKIIIKKRIPLEAGLGGGSSDAACAINTLNKIWKLNMNLDEKKKVASMFGSDISFFIEGKTAFVSGRGEKIRKIENGNKFDMIVVKPDFGFSTKRIFSLVNEYSEKGKLSDLEKAIENEDISEIGKRLENDFEKFLTSEDEYKEIAEIKKIMKKNGAAGTLMSGSGSSVFGIFLDKKNRDNACAELSKKWKNIFKIKNIR